MHGKSVAWEWFAAGDEYTHPLANGVRHLLICRVTLGRVFYSDTKEFGIAWGDLLWLDRLFWGLNRGLFGCFFCRFLEGNSKSLLHFWQCEAGFVGFLCLNSCSLRL